MIHPAQKTRNVSHWGGFKKNGKKGKRKGKRKRRELGQHDHCERRGEGRQRRRRRRIEDRG